MAQMMECQEEGLVFSFPDLSGFSVGNRVWAWFPALAWDLLCLARLEDELD